MLNKTSFDKVEPCQLELPTEGAFDAVAVGFVVGGLGALVVDGGVDVAFLVGDA